MNSPPGRVALETMRERDKRVAWERFFAGARRLLRWLVTHAIAAALGGAAVYILAPAPAPIVVPQIVPVTPAVQTIPYSCDMKRDLATWRDACRNHEPKEVKR